MFRSTLLFVYNNILLLLVRISRLLHYFGSSARHFPSGPVVRLCFDCTSCARRFEWQLHITFPFFFFMDAPGTHLAHIDVKLYESQGCNIRCANDTLLCQLISHGGLQDEHGVTLNKGLSDQPRALWHGSIVQQSPVCRLEEGVRGGVGDFSLLTASIQQEIRAAASPPLFPPSLLHRPQQPRHANSCQATRQCRSHWLWCKREFVFCMYTFQQRMGKETVMLRDEKSKAIRVDQDKLIVQDL